MNGIDLRNEHGAVAVLVGILMVAFVLCIALVVDLGHLHNVKVQLQRAADAAALAGAGQLDDSANQDSNATNVAKAAAALNKVGDKTGLVGEGGWVDDTSVTVDLGTWNSDRTVASRFSSPVALNTANAIKVTATLLVDHYFFFFADGTTIVADAIAVNSFEEQTTPIALVSCIATGGTSLNIKSPGLSICDITTYEFHADKDDTAAWTSLTFNPASQTNISNFLDADGVQLFNQVVYGTGLAHDGIENTSVSVATRTIPVPDFPTYSDVTRGCVGNAGLDINCGLGEDLSLDPEDPQLIRKADPTKVPLAAQTDPLRYDPLPRWYHFDDVPETTDVYDDAFTRLVTQNGTLVRDDGESAAAYQTRMQGLYEGTLPSPYGGAGDYRFKAVGNNEKFITEKSGVYIPNFLEVLRYAGYPPVWINNGTIPPALDKFLENLVDPQGKGKGATQFQTGVSNIVEPFTPGNETNSGGVGETVRLTIPVIFAGDCDNWKALSVGPVKTDIKLYYIGTASFLITRAWKSPDCFDHGPDRAIKIEFNPPADCVLAGAKTFSPQINGTSIECGGGKAPNAALEGLLRVPTKGEKEKAGVRKIYLVE